MKTSWTKGLDPQAAKDVKGAFVASLLLRQRLDLLLKDKIDASLTASRAKTSYDNPNWAYLQADQKGYERALHEIMDLVK